MDFDHQQKLLDTKIRYLGILEEKLAAFGKINTPAHIIMEHQDVKKEISVLETEIENEALAKIAKCFDRPAFITPFSQESSMPDFKQAISDTIQVLNTGIYRLRDGTVIEKIPSRHEIKNEQVKQVLAEITDSLVYLRTKFEAFVSSGEIRFGGSNDSYIISSPTASLEMNKIRASILNKVRSFYSKFRPLNNDRF